MRQRIAVLFLVPLILLLPLLAGCAGDDGGDEVAETVPAETVSGDTASEDAAEPVDEEALLNKPDPVGAYGDPVPADEATTASAVLAAAESREGETVVVEGTVSAVCPRRGCWLDVRDPATGEEIRVKVTDGDIVFPLSAVDHPIRVAGVVERIELTEEEALGWMEHEAEETGETFDPASVTGPMTIWRLRGKGAEIGAGS